jgi:outer membrane lipoprotein-sorting protein
MKMHCRPATALALTLPFLISGCSLLPTTRKLPIPKAPMITRTATPEELVAQLNQRWTALNSLTATVDIQASEVKSKEGIVKGSPIFHGHILIRKPEMLRVLGSYLGMRAFDMASDGKVFTLYMPTKSKAIKGSSSLKKKSANQMENMRPGFFLDALVARGLAPDDLYSVTAETITVEDAARKHFYSVPEYILNISRRKPDTQELLPVRVVRFHRDDLLPYQQDIYDSEGNLETQVIYSSYQDFDSSKYPANVTIKRPLEEIEIILTVEKVAENMPLTDDQFDVKVPEGTEIQNLE